MIYWILGLAAVMRLVHLFNGKHFIVSPDSYYFHRLAEQIAAGESVEGRSSGIAYLISLSPWWGSIFWPVFFGVLSTALFYMVVEKMYSKRVAIAAAFCFAIAFPGVFQQAAGAVDRDCLHLLLLGVCTFGLYFLYDRPKTVILIITACLALMWYEWGHIAIATLVIGGVAVPFLAADALWFTRSWRKALPYLVIALGGMGAVAFAGITQRFSSLGGISELAPLDGREFLAYLALIPAFIVGALCLAKRRKFSRADLFVVCWIVGTLALGLLSRRLWVFSVPAYSLLGGIGIAWVWKKRLLPKWALAALCVVMVGFSGYYAYHIDMGDPRTSATVEFQDCMKWIRENTAADAQILAWWDFGYMIEDLSGREAAMDNGSHAKSKMRVTWEALQGDDMDDTAVLTALRRTHSDYLLVYQGYPPPVSNGSFIERVFEPCDCAIGRNLKVVYKSEHIRLVKWK